MTDKKPTKAIYDFHHNVRVKNFDYLKNNGYTDGFHPRVYCDAGGHRSLWAADNRNDVTFWGEADPVNVPIPVFWSITGLLNGWTINWQINVLGAQARLNEMSRDPAFDMMIARQSAFYTLPFDLDLGALVDQSPLPPSNTGIVDNEGGAPIESLYRRKIWEDGRDGEAFPYILYPGTPNDRLYFESMGVTKDKDGNDLPNQLATGQNGHWRATDTTFNEQKDANGNVITWDVETFNTVWVYDTSDTSAEKYTLPDENLNKLYGDSGQQVSVYVGFTETTPTNLMGKEYWPETDTNGKGVLLPWAINTRTSTVQQAWDWTEGINGGTAQNPILVLRPQSPTRSEAYNTISTGYNDPSVQSFAVGAGDSDGRVIP